MADTPEHVVIPYATFLECLERRRLLRSELTQPQPPTNDADTPTVPNHPPAPVSTAWSSS